MKGRRVATKLRPVIENVGTSKTSPERVLVVVDREINAFWRIWRVCHLVNAFMCNAFHAGTEYFVLVIQLIYIVVGAFAGVLFRFHEYLIIFTGVADKLTTDGSQIDYCITA
jgi:hypothetical protein